jgi:hypothetical protein
MATIFETNFDSYSLGLLSGQNGWEGDVNEIFSVVNGTSGKEVTTNGATSDYVNKQGTAITDGYISFKCKRHTNEGVGRIYSQIYHTDVNSYARATIAFLGSTSQIQYRTGGSTFVNIQAYSLDTWYTIQINWRSSDGYVRYKVDAGSWTDWVAADETSDTPDGVRFQSGSGTVDDYAYWDDITDPTQIALDIPVANVVLSTPPPTFYIATNIDIAVPASEVILSSPAPTFYITPDIDITIPTASIVLTASAPVISALSIWLNEHKSATVTFSNSTRHNISPTNSTKHNSTFINEDKS